MGTILQYFSVLIFISVIAEVRGFNLKPFTRFVTVSKLNALSITPNSGNGALTINDALAKPINPGPHVNIKGKIINIWGIMYALSTMTTALITLPFMLVLTLMSDIFGDKKRRRVLDWAIHLWAQLAMSLVFFRPKVVGLENLPPPGETVIYVPNHTSILKVPIIARAMLLAKHVFIRREDVLDAIGTSEKCVQLLRDGNSMVLFAEGTRSPDGKLRKFKKGAFQMAKTAGVRVVPVSIANLHRRVVIRIHPPLDTSQTSVKDLRKQCFEAVNSGLLPYQQTPTETANNNNNNNSKDSSDSSD
eukprot:gene5245-10495_t